MRVLDRPIVDWPLAGAVAGLGWWVFSPGLSTIEDELLASALSNVATVLAIVGGFGLNATLLFATMDNRHVADLRKRFGRLIRRTLLGSFISMTVAAGACATAVAAVPAGWARLTLVISLALAAVKLARVTLLFYGLLGTQDRAAYEARKPAPKLRQTA